MLRHFANRLRTATMLAMTIGLASASPVIAQTPGPVSLEVNLGWAWGGSNGLYKTNGRGPYGDVLGALRVRELEGGALTTAIGLAAGPGAGVYTAECRRHPDPRIECVQAYPEFVRIALMGGWENTPGNIRVLTGPALVQHGGAFDDSGFAWVLRSDFTSRIGGPVWMNFTLGGMLVPSFDGARFQTLNGGAGIRIRSGG